MNLKGQKLATRLGEIIERKPLLAMLIISGLIGILIGFDKANWQISVETGQVLAGIVEYPVNNPNYMYHVKLFTIITQISALLLYITNSEIIVSYIVSCMLGVVVVQAISLMIFAFNRDVLLSVVGALFIYYMQYIGSGVVYAILLLGSIHTFGVLGLFFTFLTVSLIGAGSFRYGLFCLGLAPSVHPALGSWLYLIVFITAIFNFSYTREIIRRYYPYFIAGFALALLSLFYQLNLMKVLPAFDSEIKREIFYNYIKFWDAHRVTFFYNETAGKYVFFHPGIIFAVFSAFTGLLGRRFFSETPSLVFISTLFLIAGPLSLAFGLFTHIPSESLPLYLVSFMPGRFVNLSSLAIYPMLIGIATYFLKARTDKNLAIFTLIMLAWYFFMPDAGTARFYVFTVSSFLMIAGFTWVVVSGSRALPERIVDFTVSSIVFKVRYLLLAPLLIVFLYGLYGDIIKDRKHLVDRTNMDFLSQVSEREGMLLTTSDFEIVSLRSRRPVLFVIGNIDGLAMVPESAEETNNIFKKIYGVDLLSTIPPAGFRNQGLISQDFYRELWEHWTVSDWQKIMVEFGVSDILTLSDWKLKLPKAVETDSAILYTIPGFKGLDSRGAYPGGGLEYRRPKAQ
ncbi:MAG: hypothetical protein V3V95_01850 [Thermodesulfobacteriota bacterium]